MPKLTLTTVSAIAACSDAEALLGALKQCATDILGNLERMAAILRRLDQLGVSVSIDHALIPYIRMIANGQLSASCLIACAADPALLQKAITLPLAIQQKIADDEPFEVLSDDGKPTHRRPSEMAKRELGQVFANGRERTPEEKRQWLKGSANKSTALRARLAGFVDPNYPDGREHLSETDSGPRPEHSAVAVELNWAAKKVVAAAVAWHKANKADDDFDDRDFERALDGLNEAIEDYLEFSEPKAKRRATA